MITPLELVIAFFLILGTAIRLLSSIGLIRFGDVYLRMHASTKASTLGTWFIMVGVTLYFSDPLITVKLIALLLIYFFTSPTGTQVLAQGAHLAGAPMVKETWIDELAESEHRQSTALPGSVRPDDMPAKRGTSDVLI